MNVLGYTESGAIRVIFDGDEGESTVPDDMGNRHRQMIAEWEAAGNTIPPFTPPAPTVDTYRTHIQSCIDAKAKERNYDNGHTIATYVNSSVQAWAAEAQAFVAWRDAVWVYAFDELAKVEGGQREAPTPEQFCDELPVLEWPA